MPSDKPQLLAVDDDPEILDLLRRGLAVEGFNVRIAANGKTALRTLKTSKIDVVVLDIMMPDLDGFEVVKKIRSTSDVPVLFLSARKQVRDRISGLDAGGDDYLPKPFVFAELVSRLRALLRRPGTQGVNLLTFAGIAVDTEARRVVRGSNVLDLTAKEFDLLVTFLNNPNRVLAREHLLESVWSFGSSASSNVVDVYVGYLRRKLEDNSGSRLIWTVRGIGYVLRGERA
ncbi:MAG: DNA-binding response regulator [Chloroflexi bacterium]|nr:DNA-binding response regulator [Chloroflexota bacterium]HCU72332.1 DNA-binding response regulator [Chloroflexota bacterium]|tara:strand:- start:13412 stop:14101 length:690 start_codon:yes stop_codon:yes gene_type:complete